MTIYCFDLDISLQMQLAIENLEATPNASNLFSSLVVKLSTTIGEYMHHVATQGGYAIPTITTTESMWLHGVNG